MEQFGNDSMDFLQKSLELLLKGFSENAPKEFLAEFEDFVEDFTGVISVEALGEVSEEIDGRFFEEI